MTQREILVTHALPYANGPLHIGHLLGYIQSDIWVRARRMAGDTVHFVAADDVHGTPIMLAAEKAGMSPEEFIKGMQISHEADFRDFGVDHDYYYTTHSPENRELAEYVYLRLREVRSIAQRNVSQFYDPVKAMFLPDRYIKGECPVCGTPDQYGDNCENCGSTYAPTDLKNPYSVVSGARPEMRDSEHYFFEVGKFADFLREWLAGDVAHPSVKAKLKEWLDSEGGVRDWDISRDAPYFGFEIPDTNGTKFFYVWLDAPIGYLASFKKYCASEKGNGKGLSPGYFHRFMRVDDPEFLSEAEMHHFLGKDIVNFHGLFWPAMLKGAGFREPTALHVNGYLTVNGAKMSKSRGTFIQARTYLDAGLNPDYLRYYFATMLSAAPTDIDLDLKAFEERVNSHLVGKFINIASRTAGFIHKHFDGKLASSLGDDGDNWYGRAVARKRDVEYYYLGRYQKVPIPNSEHLMGGEFARALLTIGYLSDEANAIIQNRAPWVLAKEGKLDELHKVCTLAINLFRVLAVYLKPIIPFTISSVEKFLNVDPFATFDCVNKPLLNHTISEYVQLITRIDPTQIETMIESSKDSLAPEKPAQPAAPAKVAAAAPKVAAAAASAPTTISIEDFAKLDLRIGTVLHCGFVEGSDKLLRFELDAGELGKRQIFSGIRASYGEPEKLVGRKVVFIANLAPRKMRFGMSEGMILSAAGNGGPASNQLFLLDADDGARAGMQVK
ncbi:MAG: methionine--tRNA ligase [Rudaea sp.]|nr:methionine--tRNA ligase [Rudaea sp.]